jgi:tetratricopeptide (TPR) repeat protein
VASAIARSLRGAVPGEGSAHAELAARLRMRALPGSWEPAREMIDLAASGSDPSLWTLRMLQGRARATSDDAALLAVTKRLVERSTRPAESAALLFYAAQAALRLDQIDEARTLLERATVQDPGDVLQWGLLAGLKARAGDPRGAAEAYESLARTSGVAHHQLAAFYEAGRLWIDGVGDEGRATSAFEAAAALDVTHQDVFDRLSRLYAARKRPSELAELLERRIERISDPEARLAAEVQRGRLLLEAGEVSGARRAFEAALSRKPDDPGALTHFADLCIVQSDWESAEQALVRLTRLLPTAEEQRGVYARLGELYSHRLLNLSRAEVALKEVLKRAPEDDETSERLVEIYKRQNDSARAVETQQELLSRAQSPEEKRKRVLELATLHERTGRDPRRAEKTLEAARRESPQDIALLRALAEFYTRHHQAPAVNILLDRAAADARRALASGRFDSGPFEVIATVFDLRGKNDAARTVREMHAAAFAGPAELRGAGYRAFDPALDDLLAPELLTPALRSLLARTGEALDAALPIDLTALRASPLSPEAPIARVALRAAAAIGLRGLHVFSSPRLHAGCIPAGSDPPSIVVDEALGEPAGGFLVFRALKLVAAQASVLGRVAPIDLSALVCGWLKCFNPTWQPKGVLEPALAAAHARVAAVMPGAFEPEVGVLALEAAGALDDRQALLGTRALEWANRVALLALGDPNGALDAIARASGTLGGAPRESMARIAWIGRTAEAYDLVTFAVSEAFVMARSRLGIDG